MQIKNILKVAGKSIFKSRMRSLLTALGIIIGVAAVVVMVAIGDGAQMQVEQQISALGSNLLIIFPGSTIQGELEWVRAVLIDLLWMMLIKLPRRLL